MATTLTKLVAHPIAVLAIASFVFAAGCTGDDGSSGPNGTEDASAEPDVTDDTGWPDAGEDPSADPVADTQPDATVEPGPPGSLCNCDSDCETVEGHPGICVYGICMTQASATCSDGGSQAECASGSRCWGLTNHEGSICWPDCDAYTCAGGCDSDGSCVMTESTSCDPACGSYCAEAATDTPAGDACESSADCGDGSCYQDVGFLGGYCLEWDCTTGGEACGDGGICVPGLGSNDTNVCMGSCEGGCRPGYECAEHEGVSFCFPGCSAPTDCPEGYTCGADEVCVYDFECDDTIMEPNESLAAAQAVTDAVEGLQICDGDEDWFSFVPSAPDTLYVIGARSVHLNGNIDDDLVLGDGTVLDESFLFPTDYNEGNPVGPTDLEAMSVLGAAGADPLYLHVYGVSGATNDYEIEWRQLPWGDGPSCEGAGFTEQQCRAISPSGYFVTSELVPFPASTDTDPYIGDGVFFDSGLTSTGRPTYGSSSARWAKRELVMAIRYAIHVVQETYPGTTPLGIGEVSMPDGTTSNGHPNGTHYYSSNVDVAYYILPEYQHEWGNMVYRVICEDTSSLTDYSAVDTTTTGCCVEGSEDTHIVDIPRTALFLATVASTHRMRVVGVDTAVVDDLRAEYRRLRDEGIITQDTYNEVNSGTVSANNDSSWVWHFHHMHISFCVEDDPC